MAVISKIFLATAALVALVNAAPLQARDMVTETTWTTVDVDITVWVDQNGAPYSTETGTPYAPTAGTPPKVSTTPTTSAAAAAQPSTTTTTSQAPANAGGSFYQNPSPSTTAPAAPAPPAATTTTTTQAPAPQATTSAAPAAYSSPAQPVSGSTDGTCDSAGSACSGDVTHYDGGLGACGFNINTNSDLVVALPFEFMGTASNSNPYCGKTITVVNPQTGKSVQGKVGDKCMGCSGRAIDLTNAFFDAVAPGCDGRCSGYTWYLS